MSENFWATQDAAIAMGHAGKAVGRRQGQEEGYQDGLADGFARGRKYGQDEGVAAMQAQLDALNQQRNALQELSNGLVMALGAAVDVLKGASTDDKVRFAQSYVHRVDQALQKGMLRVAPRLLSAGREPVLLESLGYGASAPASELQGEGSSTK